MKYQDYQIFVISLERSMDRRHRVAEEFSNLDIQWEFIDAIDGSKLSGPPNNYNQKKVQRLLGYQLTSNEIGCYLSHQKAWELVTKNNKTAVILEDDFTLSNLFLLGVNELIENQKDWEIVRLQGLYSSSNILVKKLNHINIVKNIGDPVGATAYILKPSIAKKLIEFSNEIYEPLDHYLEHKSKHGIVIHATQPYLVKNSGVITTIIDRPIRRPVKGLKKLTRSINRLMDRMFAAKPWFPK